MILIHGELLPSEKSGDVLASLPALLASTLTQPPPDILMVDGLPWTGLPPRYSKRGLTRNS